MITAMPVMCTYGAYLYANSGRPRDDCRAYIGHHGRRSNRKICQPVSNGTTVVLNVGDNFHWTRSTKTIPRTCPYAVRSVPGWRTVIAKLPHHIIYNRSTTKRIQPPIDVSQKMILRVIVIEYFHINITDNSSFGLVVMHRSRFTRVYTSLPYNKPWLTYIREFKHM